MLFPSVSRHTSTCPVAESLLPNSVPDQVPPHVDLFPAGRDDNPRAATGVFRTCLYDAVPALNTALTGRSSNPASATRVDVKEIGDLKINSAA